MVEARDEPVEDGLPFSVRLRNDNLRLRNLLNPPQFESSLLGEPGIMFVWNEDQIIFIQGKHSGDVQRSCSKNQELFTLLH